MKRLKRLSVLIPMAVLAMSASAAALESTISDVIVFADRAQVTRQASVNLTTATATHTFERLPGWIDPGSVRVTLLPAAAGEIVDVRVEKQFLAQANEERVREAEGALVEITDQIGTIDDEVSVLRAEAAQIESIRAFTIQKLPKDMATREIKIESFGDTVDFVAERLRKNRAAQRELNKRRRGLTPELAARQKRLDDLRNQSRLEERSVVVEVKGSATRRGTLKLSYLTPGATWEPVAELRAAPAGTLVGLNQFAVVTQTTGEDWTTAKVSLSTQRPTVTMRLPELEALLLDGGTTLAQVVQPAQQSFQQAEGRWSSGNQYYSQGRHDYADNVARQLKTAQRVRAVFDKLQKRGTTAHYIAGSQTVRADGRSVRMPIGKSNLNAKYRILAAPELTLNAARTVDLVNTGEQPLLPGKVSLFVDGAFLGTTELDFVTRGEAFSMFVGVEDKIKLSRELDKKHSKYKQFGKRTRIQVSYVVSAENLSEIEQTVDLNERVPVSQVEQIKVSKVKVTPTGTPDSQGMLRWQRTLRPKEKRTYRIEYTLDYPTTLLAQMRQNPAQRRKARRVYEQIESLEDALR